MQSTRQTTPYEVICQRCDVTFPVGTRHCIHCGGPIGRGRGRGLLATVAAANTSADVETVEIGDDEEVPRRAAFSPVSLLWLVLIGGGAIYRACTEG